MSGVTPIGFGILLFANAGLMPDEVINLPDLHE